MATVGQKADHVRGQGQTRKHHCHWPGCEAAVPPAMWGCKKHWFNAIWQAYEPGQEVNGTPSKEYVAVALEVRQWIHEHGDE